MKKELEYFMIDGEFGGNQDWFTNIVMNVGGCGAATACDSCIYLAKYKGMKKLYPFDLEQMDKEAYKKFSQIMKPYIRPRVQGVKKPEWYIEGLAKYISDVNEKYGTDYQIDMYWSSFLVTLCSEIMLYIETPLVSYSYSLNEVSHSCTS